MSDGWPADRPMNTLDEMLEAFEHDDLDELSDHFEGCLIDVGPLDWIWEVTDDSMQAWVSSSLIGGTSLEFGFPITRSELYSALGELNSRFILRSATAHLPDPDSFEEAEDEAESTRALAAFFGVELREFTDALCGGWYPVEATHLTGNLEIPLRWFAAGSPMQALLGIGEDYATLACPIEIPGGLAGPPRLEAEAMVDIELRRGPQTIGALGEALSSVLASTRADWDHCQGCLNFGPVHSTGYCASCEYTYLRLIVDWPAHRRGHVQGHR